MTYLLTVYSHFDVWAPEELTGNWADVPAVYARLKIKWTVALATRFHAAAERDGRLARHRIADMLLVPASICPPAWAVSSPPAPPTSTTRPHAHQLPNMPPPSPPQTAPSPPPTSPSVAVDAQRAIIRIRPTASAARRFTTSVIQSNMSTYLHEGVSWNYTLLPQAAYGLPASPSVSSDVLAVDTTSVAINLTIYRQPEEGKMDCTKYRWVPLVYVIFVPIWLMLTIAWTWNTYYKNINIRDPYR